MLWRIAWRHSDPQPPSDTVRISRKIAKPAAYEASNYALRFHRISTEERWQLLGQEPTKQALDRFGLIGNTSAFSCQVCFCQPVLGEFSKTGDELNKN